MTNDDQRHLGTWSKKDGTLGGWIFQFVMRAAIEFWVSKNPNDFYGIWGFYRSILVDSIYIYITISQKFYIYITKFNHVNFSDLLDVAVG